MQQANNLILEIEKRITKPYKNWRIGISESTGYDTEGYTDAMLFGSHVTNTEEEVQQAHDYFVKQGMVSQPKIGHRCVYLYLYSINGSKLPDWLYKALTNKKETN